MTPDIPTVIVGVPMAFALGLVFGMGPCLLSCLPYLGPVFLGHDLPVRRSWRVLLPVGLGRMTAYASLAALAGWMGQALSDPVPAASVHLALGAATMMIGGALVLRRRSSSCNAAVPAGGPTASPQVVHWHPSRPGGAGATAGSRPLMPGGLYLMGIGMALTPCAPLGIVLFSAAALGGVGTGLSLGLSFGLGAVTVPSLFFGIGVSFLTRQLRQQLQSWLPRIEWACALLLILVGARQVFAVLMG